MLKDFNAVKITIASPQDIMNWSYGEVTKAETINYRTYKAEPGGLMAEEIFGPTKDYECYCGKYKKIRYKGIVCDRCGVEVIHKRVRRERMGHIKLAAPVAHVWFSNGVPNRLALILDVPQKKLETVVYYARYIVTDINFEEQQKAIESLENLKSDEQKQIEEELAEKIEETKGAFDDEIADLKKSSKDKKKLEMQIERIHNSQKSQIAKIKSAYDQKQENLGSKFDDIESLISTMRLGTTLSEEDYQLLDEYSLYFFEAGMGAEAVKVLLDKIDVQREIDEMEVVLKTSKSQLKKARIIQRLRILKGIKKSGVNISWIVLDLLPVIPPDIRPIIQLPGGRFATYDLNDLYRRVINRNNRLRRLIELGAPEIILRNEKRMLQESVDALLDNNHKPGAPALNNRGLPFKSLSDMLRGKQGRFRQNLLGKRVDYSGRAVIIAGPTLRFDQCGLPKNIALELFKPFIIRELISRGIAANPTRAKAIFESKTDDVWDILEQVIENRPVLLNRAPTLHKQSILAFFPVLIEGNAIRLHPMTCRGYNADFDGDQMAVHLPLSDKAVEEVISRMFAKDNMLWLRDGTPITNLEKDMALGIYFLTLMKGDVKNITHFYSSEEELRSAYTLSDITFSAPVKLLRNEEIIVTTAGRILFNKALPAGYRFMNQTVSKFDMADIAAEIFRDYGRETAIECLDKMKGLGFKYATKLGFSISMEDFKFGNEEILEKGLGEFKAKEKELFGEYNDGMITEKELDWLKQQEWEKKTEEIQEDIWALAKSKPETENLIELDRSGATPVSSWVKKISGVQGSVSDMYGNRVNLPLTGNFEKGIDNFQYFVAAKAVRKSMTDVSLRTSDSGYLTRRLVDVAQDVITNTEDCGTPEGIIVNRNEERQRPFIARIKGRFLIQDVKDSKGNVLANGGDEITLKLAKQIEESDVEAVNVRSPLHCEIAHGICQKCYGHDNGTGQLVDIGEAVGVIAAQALGEPATQLTLKSKSDARAAKTDITQGLPRVEELFEARTPKALALLADFEGTVKIIEDKKKIKLRLSAVKKTHKKYDIAEGDELAVKNGEKVKKGDTLVVKANKDIIKAESIGVIELVSQTELQVVTEKDVEVEKSTNNMSDIMIKDGEKVERGQQLTFGSIDPKELSILRGVDAAQKYIINGIQEVMSVQGIQVDDRHIEIIVRQMSRYGLINNSTESELHLPGDYVDILDIAKENKLLEEQAKEEIRYDRVLLGITNSAIRTESFLSAASFEQQIRVLTDAALIGKVDYLRGLKENVIIGRPVPLGEVLKKKLGLLKEQSEETLIEEFDAKVAEESVAVSE